MSNKDLFYRAVEFNEAVDTDAREAELSFSSEEPVKRWFGDEVLLHGQENVDLSYLRAVGSVIYGHDPSDIQNIIGPIKEARLYNRRGIAKIGFDNDEKATLAMLKAGSKSLRGVSVGYTIQKAIQLEVGDEWINPETNRTYSGPALIATRWTPLEITLTPIPADMSVGICREATRSLDGIEIELNQTHSMEEPRESDLRLKSRPWPIRWLREFKSRPNRSFGCPLRSSRILWAGQLPSTSLHRLRSRS